MRIAFFLTQYMELGGVENVVREIAKRISKKHDVYLIIRNRPQNTKNFEKFWKEVFVIPESDSYWKFLKSRKLVEQFILSRKIDVVNFHNWSPALPFVFSKFKKVVTFHGTSTEQAMRDGKWLKVPFMWLVEEFIMNTADAVISITKYHMRLFRTRKPLYIIPNGVNTEFFDPKKVMKNKVRKQLELTKPTALFVGKFMPVKGLKYFIEAAKQIPTMNFVVVGEGEEAYLLENAPKNVRWLGPVYDKKKLRDIYGACEVLVIPSENEGLPLVLLEGLSMKLPIVATSAGGITETLQASGRGILIQPKDLKGLISSLGKAASLKFKKGGEKIAGEVVSWDHVINKYERVFENFIK